MDKVKLKQIEALVRDGNHADIQEDEECREEHARLREQMTVCRSWVDKA